MFRTTENSSFVHEQSEHYAAPSSGSDKTPLAGRFVRWVSYLYDKLDPTDFLQSKYPWAYASSATSPQSPRSVSLDQKSAARAASTPQAATPSQRNQEHAEASKGPSWRERIATIWNGWFPPKAASQSHHQERWWWRTPLATVVPQAAQAAAAQRSKAAEVDLKNAESETPVTATPYEALRNNLGFRLYCNRNFPKGFEGTPPETMLRSWNSLPEDKRQDYLSLDLPQIRRLEAGDKQYKMKGGFLEFSGSCPTQEYTDRLSAWHDLSSEKRNTWRGLYEEKHNPEFQKFCRPLHGETKYTAPDNTFNIGLAWADWYAKNTSRILRRATLR